MAEGPRLIPKGKDIFYAGGPFDRAEPRSLYNIMPKEARETVDRLELEWFAMGEKQLQELLRPSRDTSYIRLAFWREYDSAQASLTPMTIKGMMQHLGGLPSFRVMQDLMEPKQLMWIITPPTSYDNVLEEALQRSMKRINEILDLDIVRDGVIDHKLAELQMKVMVFLDIRKFGKPTEKLEIKQQSFVTRSDIKKLGGLREVDLDDKIRALEQKLGRSEVTDVESE